MIERLSFEKSEAYMATEAAIHMCRYSLAQQHCEGRRVLDISCGEGYGSSLMAGWGAAEVHGVDIAADAIARAQDSFRDERITFHCLAAKDLEDRFEAQSFDLVVCLETMEHVPDAHGLLTALRRLLRPDGALILSCPNDWWYYPTDEQGNPYHQRKYRYDEFLGLTRETLGEPSQLLLGVPASGYANVAVDSTALRCGAGDSSPMAMFRFAPRIQAGMLPSDEEVTPENCSYFVGVWGATVAPVSLTAFPTSMDRLGLAREQQIIQNLREEIAQLEDEVRELEGQQRARRDAELLAAAWRAECEYLRQVALQQRGAPAPPRSVKPFAAAILSRIRGALRRR